MATFFSATDIATLREEGNDRNHFVSLIVNNAGVYTAAITRRMKLKMTINSTYTYKSFDDVEKTGTMVEEEEGETLAYNYLEVIKEGEVDNPFLEIDERLSDIRENKAKAISNKANIKTETKEPIKSYTPITSSWDDYDAGDLFTSFDSNPPTSYIPTKPKKHVKSLDPNEQVSIPKGTINSVVLQLITGSIAIADSSRIDPKKWVTQMVPLFDKRFDNNMTLYKYWIELFGEFILYSFTPEEYVHIEDEYIDELIANVYEVIYKLPENKYIKEIKEMLLSWMK